MEQFVDKVSTTNLPPVTEAFAQKFLMARKFDLMAIQVDVDGVDGVDDSEESLPFFGSIVPSLLHF